MTREPELHSAFTEAETPFTQADAPQVSDYIGEISGDDYDSLSQAEKIELLESLFIIMKSYAHLGHGHEPVNKFIEEFETTTSIPAGMINCEDASDDDE